MAQPRHTILIADPDMDARMRLKQASSTVPMFGKVLNSSTLNDARHVLEKDEKVDILFMSYRFEQASLAAFIREARETKQGKYCVFIIMLPSTNHSSASIIQNVLVGLDGILVEPFCVKGLIELSLLATELSKKRDEERNREAIRVLVHEILDTYSSINELRRDGRVFKEQWMKLKEMSQVVKTLSEQDRAYYLELLVEQFSQLQTATTPNPHRYNGASSRIKRKLEERLLAELNGVG